ncbi:hypothetical protein OH77DRAFT_590427 [Trametes cingulata]|nr:hypothetical protein OH77DRAFT_590427 [Trametes cingulata]
MDCVRQHTVQHSFAPPLLPAEYECPPTESRSPVFRLERATRVTSPHHYCLGAVGQERPPHSLYRQSEGRSLAPVLWCGSLATRRAQGGAWCCRYAMQTGDGLRSPQAAASDPHHCDRDYPAAHRTSRSGEPEPRRRAGDLGGGCAVQVPKQTDHRNISKRVDAEVPYKPPPCRRSLLQRRGSALGRCHADCRDFGAAEENWAYAVSHAEMQDGARPFAGYCPEVD